MDSLYQQIQKLKYTPTIRSNRFMCSKEEQIASQKRAEEWKKLTAMLKDLYIAIVRLEITGEDPERAEVLEAEAAGIEKARNALKMDFWTSKVRTKETA